MNNMREVELSKSKQKYAKQTNGKKELTYEEQKALKKKERKVQNAERVVEKLEEEISAIETKMGEPGFYESEAATKIMEDYKSKKEALDAAVEKWDQLVNELEG